jgi:protein-tyrosine phosphatase
MRIRRVLLVCSGNTCRSPMAAVLLRHLWEQQAAPGWELEVSSAGTSAFPGLAASPHAVTAMRSHGLDLAGHLSRAADGAVVNEADLILAMTQRHKEHLLALRPDLGRKVYTLGEYSGAGVDVPDPFGGELTDYETTAQSLVFMLLAVVERIRREGTSES